MIAPTVMIKCFPEGQTHRKLIPRSSLPSEEKGKQEHTQRENKKKTRTYIGCVNNQNELLFFSETQSTY